MPCSYARPRTYALTASPMPDLADYLTTEEAATALGLHIVTVQLFKTTQLEKTCKQLYTLPARRTNHNMNQH
jgi:hypothetical protein